MARIEPNIAAHLEWIGFVKPRGLVVSATALVTAGAILNRRDVEGQRLLRQCVKQRNAGVETEPYLPDFREFAKTVLGWNFSPRAFAGTEQYPIPPELEVRLPESGTILRPDFAVQERCSTAAPPVGSSDGRSAVPTDESPKWQLLVQVLAPATDFDRVTRNGSGIDASPHSQLERLLRESDVSAGVLFNGVALRLVSAPRGESSGWLDFHVADMVLTAGRPICAAMRLLLKEQRLLSLPADKRLPALLVESRKFQNKVSEQLAEQVLHSLYELLRGLQAAHDATKGELLRDHLTDSPDEIYRALLTVVLRLVFLLYAEERDMLPNEDRIYAQHYSLAGLYERLREDAALYPDTMEQRYGGWAQLLALFRMVHDGAHSRAMRMPERRSVLFDPDRYLFLEGRRVSHARPERIVAPLVPDGTVFRVLEKLLVLDGERISYRALDVEHLGSVYETMMGFRLETAKGRSIAIRTTKKHGASATVNLEKLLDEAPNKRIKWIRDRTDRKLTERVGKAVRASTSLDSLHAALESVIDRNSTPDLVPRSAMVLQPSEERRRSGSHYTPRELTEPIVRTALEPVLERIRATDGAPPRPEQILDLKVCDPAAGSGAFLVEACRMLGDQLVASWQFHKDVPDLEFGEDEIVRARRMVARRCLYGVDRNPVAVDLTKLSLRLVTLTRNQSFTFVDHAIRHGDSLVGLTQRQIEAFHWKGDAPYFQEGFEAMKVREHVEKVATLSKHIRRAEERNTDSDLRKLWQAMQVSLDRLRLFGDLVLLAFFVREPSKDRETKRAELAETVLEDKADHYLDQIRQLRNAEQPLIPFHWEIEFPEAFKGIRRGFDVMVGNPPFAGKNTVAASNVSAYPEWLKTIHPQSHGNADIAAHFFRRSFSLMHKGGGVFGLLATNTIAQGDTRSTGLGYICCNNGIIYNATRRVQWPGLAAVIVSIIHVIRGAVVDFRNLDGKKVENITAFLFHTGTSEDPRVLKSNKNKSFVGSYILGMGFTFDDQDTKGVATSISEMQRLINEDPKNSEVIFPYIGGQEVNSSPTHAHHRYVINFRDYPLMRMELGKSWIDADHEERREWLNDGIVPKDYPHPVASDWPKLKAIVKQKVMPERSHLTRNAIGRKRAKFWWQYGSLSVRLYSANTGLKRVLVVSRISQHNSFTFLPSKAVFSDSLIVFPTHSYSAFCTLQSRLHEIWARFFGSSLEDRLRYTPTDCFETFPFPEDWESLSRLEAAGREYYDFRMALMRRNDEGLTKTYNRFHDPYEDDPAILKLRQLHTVMDREVLDTYGWSDISPDCDFIPEHTPDEGQPTTGTEAVRYWWPEPVRNEVLGRLLELNAARATKQRRRGAPARARRRPRPSSHAHSDEPLLIQE